MLPSIQTDNQSAKLTRELQTNEGGGEWGVIKWIYRKGELLQPETLTIIYVFRK